VWIQTVYQEQYARQNTAENKQYLRRLLDQLSAAGVNVVFFQVRSKADAFYSSQIEPWSRQLTGREGKAPSPAWDPLAFMVDECHQRGMELHAWVNPYRGPRVSDITAANSPVKKFPKRFIKYNGTYYFNPAMQANRDYICSIVADIVTRYDIDGIHFDDYFYPYPAKEKFPDAADYKASGSKLSLGDWRRRNVDLLIEQVHKTISEIKPWLRFGISPFGIWRNKRTDAGGSNTTGLQGYDDLYADTPSWAKRGWIDYQIPQLYWEMDHSRASYRALCHWWAGQAHGRHIYIGQDIKKTVDTGELDAKIQMAAEDEAIEGHCWWYATIFNTLPTSLYTTRALVPEYLWLRAEPAERPTGLTCKDHVLSWHSDENARKWVVYRFDSSKHIDTEKATAIVAVTYTNSLPISHSGYYVVTALDHTNAESAASAPLHVKQ
jgi:uncharacterized lipoprotein YddW (UPF0748 family)